MSEARRRVSRPLPFLVVLLLAVLTCAGLGAAPSAADGPVVLDDGHLDVFHVERTADGLDLVVEEDITGTDVQRRPEDVELRVKESARFDQIPPEYPDSPASYLLWQVQEYGPGLLWPGWSTEALIGKDVTSADIVVESVDGPAKVSLFQDDIFTPGRPRSVLAGGGFQLPATIHVGEPTHVHSYWSFPKRGVYTMRVRAVATTPGGRRISSPSRTYRWVVGDVDPSDPPPSTPGPTNPPTSTPSSTPSSTPAPTATAGPRPTTRPTATPTRRPGSAGPSRVTAAGRIALTHGHLDLFHVRPAGRGITLALREDVTGTGVIRDPRKVEVWVPDAARRRLPSGVPGGGRTVHLLPMTQDPTLPWPGWSTERLAGSRFSSARIAVREQGPGDVHIFTNGIGGARGVLTGGRSRLPGTIPVPRPAHVHANWVFTRPGTYVLTARAGAGSARSPERRYVVRVGNRAIRAAQRSVSTVDGRGSSAYTPPARADDPASLLGGTPADGWPGGSSGPLGGGGGGEGGAPSAGRSACTPVRMPGDAITDGHLDLGAALRGGTLVPLLRDDRGASPRWVDPKSVTVGLGPAARHPAPAGIGFVARPGRPVWMIGSTQERGVPWLGANSQHPSLRSGTRGPVRWTLEKTSGPGHVAHFLPGDLGAGVGQRLFDDVGGPRSFDLPENTHQHGVWVFTAPGRYAVTVSQRARTTGGSTVRGRTTLRFVVPGCAPRTANGRASTAAPGAGSDPGRPGGPGLAPGGAAPAPGAAQAGALAHPAVPWLLGGLLLCNVILIAFLAGDRLGPLLARRRTSTSAA